MFSTQIHEYFQADCTPHFPTLFSWLTKIFTNYFLCLQEWHKPRSKVSLSTTLQIIKNKLTPLDLSTYFKAVSDLRPILQDQFLYKMTMLLTLTFFCPALTDTYTKMIWSHLVSSKRTLKQTNEIMAEIHNSLLPICRMSKVLMKMAIV